MSGDKDDELQNILTSYKNEAEARNSAEQERQRQEEHSAKRRTRYRLILKVGVPAFVLVVIMPITQFNESRKCRTQARQKLAAYVQTLGPKASQVAEIRSIVDDSTKAASASCKTNLKKLDCVCNAELKSTIGKSKIRTQVLQPLWLANLAQTIENSGLSSDSLSNFRAKWQNIQPSVQAAWHKSYTDDMHRFQRDLLAELGRREFAGTDIGAIFLGSARNKAPTLRDAISQSAAKHYRDKQRKIAQLLQIETAKQRASIRSYGRTVQMSDYQLSRLQQFKQIDILRERLSYGSLPGRCTKLAEHLPVVRIKDDRDGKTGGVQVAVELDTKTRQEKSLYEELRNRRGGEHIRFCVSLDSGQKLIIEKRSPARRACKCPDGGSRSFSPKR